MAIMSAAQFEQAFTIAGAATPYEDAGDRPLFNINDLVFDLADAPGAAATGIDASSVKFRWKVVGMSQKPTASGYLDQTDAVCNAANTVTYTGFQHDNVTGAPSGVTGASTQSRPYFYNLQSVTDTSITRNGIPQARITNNTAWLTYINSIQSSVIG